jgi:Mg-chelatase subunit ChlD
LALREACAPVGRTVDVALVLDASTSMTERTSSGRQKLEAAKEAAQNFLSELRYADGDQAALVQFNVQAELLQPLTRERDRLAAALSRLDVQQYTRIDLGIEYAARELVSERHDADNQRVLILLTDGRSNPVGPEKAEAKAEEAKLAGTIIFTIGLGEDVDLVSLQRIATRPEYFYRAPDGEDLSRIYAEVAGAISCPAEQFWGRR